MDNDVTTSFTLCAYNTHLAAAWESAFAGVDRVRVFAGNILDVSGDAVVSPANSFGNMNGGVDRVYLWRFGDGLVVRLQQLLAEQHGGELPVGQAVTATIERRSDAAASVGAACPVAVAVDAAVVAVDATGVAASVASSPARAPCTMPTTSSGVAALRSDATKSSFMSERASVLSSAR